MVFQFNIEIYASLYWNDAQLRPFTDKENSVKKK